jgi:hypothetical protein
MMFAGDAVFAVGVEHPDWFNGFEHDPEEAARVRVRLLKELATTGKLLVATHMPFPSLGKSTATPSVGYLFSGITDCRPTKVPVTRPHAILHPVYRVRLWRKLEGANSQLFPDLPDKNVRRGYVMTPTETRMLVSGTLVQWYEGLLQEIDVILKQHHASGKNASVILESFSAQGRKLTAEKPHQLYKDILRVAASFREHGVEPYEEERRR